MVVGSGGTTFVPHLMRNEIQNPFPGITFLEKAIGKKITARIGELLTRTLYSEVFLMPLLMSSAFPGSNECIPPPINPLSEIMSPELLDLCRLYPDPYCRSLRKAIADKNGCSPDQVLVDCGADSLISLAIREHLSPSLHPTLVLPSMHAKDLHHPTHCAPRQAHESLPETWS